MREYTEAIHRRRLSRIVRWAEKGQDPQRHCPSNWGLSDDSKRELWSSDTRTVCGLCFQSVGLPKEKCLNSCPCFLLGREEAIRRAKLYLEGRDGQGDSAG